MYFDIENMGESAKKELMDYISSLPDNISEEEIAYHIYVREEIRIARKQAEENTYTQDQVEEMFKKWLP